MGTGEHRHAPLQGSVLCRADELPEGGCKELRFGDGDSALSILLYRHADGIRGYVNSCPHFSLPLNAQPGRFLLLAGERVMCAWHCAVFRLDDGVCTEGPAEGMRLQQIAVNVVGDAVCWDAG